jgi:hypothetical protein
VTTKVEFTATQTGPITLHINTMAADVQIVADERASGTWIEVSTPDTSGPAVDTIRRADFRDQGRSVHLKLNEGQHSGGTVISGNNIYQAGGMTIVNGMVMGGTSFSSGITVRAITEPGSAVEVKTMSGDVTTKNVSAVRAQTMSGDIEIDGITEDSSLKSMSGDIRVSGAAINTGSREVTRAGTAGGPRVTASTMSGDVTGDGVDLHARSMSGRVRQRR